MSLISSADASPLTALTLEKVFIDVFPAVISEKHMMPPGFSIWNKFAKKVSSLLEKAEIRASIDDRNETVGKKIRESEQNKVPYMAIIGDKEVSNNSVSIRALGGNEIGEMNINELINFIKREEKNSLINN